MVTTPRPDIPTAIVAENGARFGRSMRRSLVVLACLAVAAGAWIAAKRVFRIDLVGTSELETRQSYARKVVGPGLDALFEQQRERRENTLELDAALVFSEDLRGHGAFGCAAGFDAAFADALGIDVVRVRAARDAYDVEAEIDCDGMDGAKKYVLDRRIGGGGMAEVFLGHAAGAEGFRKPVAIKRVLPAYSDDAAFAEMFVAEARLSAQLQHPNIVTVLDFDRDPEGRLFLVMEHVDGANLDALAAAGELPVPAAIHIAAEMLRGLGHAHDASVVHRDVSPHNVLIGWTGEVKSNWPYIRRTAWTQTKPC